MADRYEERDDDPGKLSVLLEDLQEVMAELAELESLDLAESDRDDLRAALEELRSAFDEARRKLDHPTAGLARRLQRAGLYGRQLLLKLLPIRGLMRVFREERQSFTLTSFRRLLEWIDVLLPSLKTALPVVEPIEELKKWLETLVKHQEEDEAKA